MLPRECETSSRSLTQCGRDKNFVDTNSSTEGLTVKSTQKGLSNNCVSIILLSQNNHKQSVSTNERIEYNSRK